MELSQIPVIFEYAKKSREQYFTPSLCHLWRTEPKYLHYHDVLEIGMCLSGSGYCYANGQRTAFHAGDVQLFLPNQPHYNVSDDSNTLWRFVNIEVPRIGSPRLSPDPVFLSGLMERIRVSGIFTQEDAPRVHSYIKDIIGLMLSQPSGAEDTAELLVAKLTALFIELSMSKTGNTAAVGVKQTHVISPALQLVSSAINHRKGVTVGEMAEVCFMSESYFRKIFTSVMGESPKSYVVRQQLQKAAGLLATTKMPVSDIATRCGFEDVSTFYRRFVRLYGVPPTEYRKSL